MKLKANSNSIILTLLMLPTVLLSAGWLMECKSVNANTLIPLGTIAASAVLFVAALVFYYMKQNNHRQSVRLYLDALCRVEGHDLNNNPADMLPCLDADKGWQTVFSRVRDCIQSYHERLREADHLRAAAEVRTRRAVVEVENLNSILRGLAEPVIAIDAYNEIILANPSAERLLNFEIEKTETKAIERVIECEALVSLLLDTRRRKTPTQKTGEISRADASGNMRTYRVTCRNVASLGENKTTHDGTQGAVAVFNDITNEKLIQKRNAEFVSAASHEMKTPLSGIKAYVELLADGDAEDEEQREEFLGVISGQADRLQRLVENLLNIARIEAGVVEVHKQSRSLNELLNEAFGVVEPTAQQKNITLVSDLSPLYLGVLADRDMLLQSAINLLSNAIKYTHPGGTVTLRSRSDDRDVVFEVEDTGVGLNPEDCDKVFEKFYRVKKDTTMAPGTGLGLPLAKHIVEDVHGGRLTLKSELGKGSTFRVTLPAARCMTEK